MANAPATHGVAASSADPGDHGEVKMASILLLIFLSKIYIYARYPPFPIFKLILVEIGVGLFAT